MIKCLVLSSAAYEIFYQVSAINVLIKKKFLNIDEIESFYSVSAGAITALLLCLKIDIDIIFNYVIDRPWNKLVSLDASKIFNAYNNCGIYDKSLFVKGFEPLFKVANIPIDITFKELYKRTKKKLHIYCTNTNTLNKQLFNYETDPNLSVVDAVYMSSSIPFIFKPLRYNGIIYNDGAFVCRFPIVEAVEESGYNTNEIFGLNLKIEKKEFNIDDSNVLNYLITMIKKYTTNKILVFDEKKIKNVTICHIKGNSFSVEYFYNLLNKIEYRKEMLNKAENEIEIFLNDINYEKKFE